jgi:hypothetical protein
MGASCFVMAMFYFINHPNKDMITYSWDVISATICVFISISTYSVINIAL